ncbi:hypothetical protein CgunFtcFv8_007433 [Champsocephalus gunnari]|uniref:ATP-dependent RNA helicase n=1 Tax=Champsocephalus gunnari TaxID=52237 RepID=A0AAN8CJP9_CHAGU|nr:hypothetical protein CgunFtcFv8_007433 [Champsocephalus gunnari]
MLHEFNITLILKTTLPTDIQAESIPLILGGGDELMAAETGSGKTGAFSMPVIRIVYETLKDEQEGKTGRASIKTGNDLGVAFEIPQQLKSQPFFASCVLKNAELKFNSGGEDFKMPPRVGLLPWTRRHAVKSTQFVQAVTKNLLVIGGVPAKDQMAALEHGVDIVVGTPGRLDNLISTGKLSLSPSYTDFINRIHNQIPQVTSDGKRLQLWSEAIKILKGEYTVRAIKEHKMDQAIIFCRTKIGCDNMEQYFIQQGGGPDSKSHQLSCVCLRGDRKPNEWKTNLERFKKKRSEAVDLHRCSCQRN